MIPILGVAIVKSLTGMAYIYTDMSDFLSYHKLPVSKNIDTNTIT